MAHHRLWLLNCRAVDLGAHPPLLNCLTRRHLDLGRKSASTHGVGYSCRRTGCNASVSLHLPSRHARRSARVLCKLSLAHLLIVSSRPRSSRRRHCCSLGGGHAVLLVHVWHVSLLRIVHLLVVLWIRCTGLRVSLRREYG